MSGRELCLSDSSLFVDDAEAYEKSTDNTKEKNLMLVNRSATKVNRDVFEASVGRLKVVGRAGVGIDNVDLAAATEHGCLVINAPTANTVAAAEHGIALLTAMARNIAQADASVKAGKWQRNKYVGVSLVGKTLAVMGFGKVGSDGGSDLLLELEVITSAEFHPLHCNLLTYSSSRGFIRLVDMRQSALCDHSARIFRDGESRGSKSFFTEIIASISDIKFSTDGRHILSRDYMNLKIDGEDTVWLWQTDVEDTGSCWTDVEDSLWATHNMASSSRSATQNMASSSRGLLTLFPDLNELTREITGVVALETQPSAPEFAPLNFPMRSVEQRMAVQSDVEANQYTLKSCVETMTAVTNLSNRLQSRTNEVQQLNAQLALLQRMYKDARAEISVLKAENKELKRKATVMFRFGGPPYAAVEEQGVVIMPSGVGNTEATPARAVQDGGKKKRPAAE
ncbi:hypothetical protein HYC85_029279 [Camellia sinensis]|uniref:D-isomer specific 2-hydroxyacid dehydrogenase catalytic domain-containing protein n=1 Tax=Camellia sinensis TaxID=4442 RepID=A0A7J7FZZ1_CAMSI|nr:hypothetical protein HYC85_029279 [Camellia sinensis]